MEFVYLAIASWVVAVFILPRGTLARALHEPAADRRARVAPVAASCAGIVALFVAGLALSLRDAIAHPFVLPFGAAPIVVTRDAGALDAFVSNAELAITLLETACLFGLYRALRGRAASRATVGVVALTFVAMSAISIASPVSNSSDLYGYVGFAIAPNVAYAPPAIPFAGEHVAIDKLLGNPRPAAWYGPLWIGISHVVVAPFTGLRAQLYALRALEVAAFAALLFAVERGRARTSELALLAVNPGIFWLYVVDGHNDLLASAVLVAAVLARRFAPVRIALVAAAGLVKLPLVVVGAVAFCDERRVVRRFAYAAIAVIACLVFSRLFGGAAYLPHLLSLSGRGTTGNERPFHIAAVVLACAVLASAIALRRFNVGATWIWASIASFPAAWYGLWGTPYAVVAGALVPFLLLEPLVTYLFSWNYAETPFASATSFVVVAGPIVYALAQRFKALRSVVVVRPPAASH